MYLKSLELFGFKSFADRTKLEFEQGLTAIVGPNGCGKSNILDSIRWVLGEQSAKTLRADKMEDCIFNGTDERKPLGMAEVSLTFADCSDTLGTEYHEVTVTRRVFRSGESEYFINKTPCRLKDIQRLFMGTGIGTDAYSFIGQGRIDMVLSAKPEDRREIFEEASGITKYKADKKEALRELEQTEANLLRLSDVIAEVKRQINSMERQAAKAKRYKVLMDELKTLDIHAARLRINEADNELKKIETELANISASIAQEQREIEEAERHLTQMRNTSLQIERQISSARESELNAQNERRRLEEQISVNRQRIEEYRAWMERDSQQIQETEVSADAKKKEISDLTAQLEQTKAERNNAKIEMETAEKLLEQRMQELDSLKKHYQNLRVQVVDLESQASHLQNQLLELDSTERQNAIRRERLLAEKNQLGRLLAHQEQRKTTAYTELEKLSALVTALENKQAILEQEIKITSDILECLRRGMITLTANISSRQSEIKRLEKDVSELSGTQSVSSVLSKLSGSVSQKILGVFRGLITIEPEYTTPAMAVLQSWADAIVTTEPEAAISVLRLFETEPEQTVRLFVTENGNSPSDILSSTDGDLLLSHISAPEHLKSLVQYLFGKVIVLNTIDELPHQTVQGAVYVTRAGSVVRSHNTFEFWTDSITRKRIKQATLELQTLEKRQSEYSELVNKLEKAVHLAEDFLLEFRKRLNEFSSSVATKRGEFNILNTECEQTRKRIETVTWEIEDIDNSTASPEKQKESIMNQLNNVRNQIELTSREIATTEEKIRQLDTIYMQTQSACSEKKIRFAEVNNKLQMTERTLAEAESRLQELLSAISQRRSAIASYQTSIDKLKDDISRAETRLNEIRNVTSSASSELSALQQKAEELMKNINEFETTLSARKQTLEQKQKEKSDLKVKHTEIRIRRQNMLERILGEYELDTEQFFSYPPPVWEKGEPSIDEIETTIAELRAKIQALGPVNLVAIQEFKELEERYNFLTQQEQDLINSKQRLMELIRKINKQTSEMFKTTFEQINEKFSLMFQKLFNGGSARLVLMDEENILESGIEIIARPPGKRPQNVTLLSGGERTLTAIALLFAIYMMKPSPFCFLDELDAALDDASIVRFVNTLKEFLTKSQFIVITHNRQTIAAADVIYGVTMREKGVSTIISMRFKDLDKTKLSNAQSGNSQNAEVQIENQSS
jgi:chromosome segregation protein